MSKDPVNLIATSPMSRMQIMAVALLIGLNGLDGFDVLAISFAAPGIAAEWGIERGMLGIVLAMEMIGMSIGSLLLGGVADRSGRFGVPDDDDGGHAGSGERGQRDPVTDLAGIDRIGNWRHAGGAECRYG